MSTECLNRACSGDYDCPGIGTCVDACTQDSDCPSGVKCLEKFDGHLDSSGWPCRDQTGRGQDDPTAHVQASSPVYWWNNKDTANPPNQLSVYIAPANVNYIKPNRDYDEYMTNFNGTGEVGMGTLASRPSTCTTGVGYWATDEHKFYKCTATNTWNLYYIPYSYPHPLQDTPDTTPPAAPTGVRIR